MKPPSPAPSPTFDPRHAWRHTLGAARADGALALVLLASAVLFAFRGVLGNGLVMWDDNLYREQIPQLQEWSGGNLLWMLTDRSWFYWHPLAYAWHAAENALFGADHRGPQAAAIALHALNAGWVLVLGCAFLGPRRGDPAPPSAGAVLGASLAAAALWALHPLRVESVAWMAEKKDLLCAFLSFAATAAWLLRATLPA
ncbi:MAG: hypothetical protein HUU06_09355, partial [Planctomycetaceae bacterium]|nr:hypothetical protein [Planctomycetaceae bacterium]